MYKVQDSSALVAGHRALLRPREGTRVSRTVVLLGLTSLLTDVSSEMVAAVLPLYLVSAAGFTPLQFGVDRRPLPRRGGVRRRSSAGSSPTAGAATRRSRSAGYGLSAICKLGLVLAGGASSAIGRSSCSTASARASAPRRATR